jgi:hypothetical protein
MRALRSTTVIHSSIPLVKQVVGTVLNMAMYQQHRKLDTLFNDAVLLFADGVQQIWDVDRTESQEELDGYLALVDSGEGDVTPDILQMLVEQVCRMR